MEALGIIATLILLLTLVIVLVAMVIYTAASMIYNKDWAYLWVPFMEMWLLIALACVAIYVFTHS